jgi:RimJ/RimL family protein N-acetyltransferase
VSGHRPRATVRDGTDDLCLDGTSEHFDWLEAGEEAVLFAGTLRLPPGGLESRPVLAWLKRTAASIEQATGTPSAWLVVDDFEIVGLISFKAPPHAGAVEIGYGVAESRRGRGHATRAVQLLAAEAETRGLDLVAETSLDNLPSQVLLERNGFERRGERIDPEEGALVVWR